MAYLSELDAASLTNTDPTYSCQPINQWTSLKRTLEKMLLNEFEGLTLTREQIYIRHNVGTCYIEKNYRDALLNLENQGKIKTNRAQRGSRKGTFPNDMLVTFAKKRSLVK